MLLIVIGIGLYYNVIIAWIIYYLIEVFISLPSGTLPWTTCGKALGYRISQVEYSLSHFLIYIICHG